MARTARQTALVPYLLLCVPIVFWGGSFVATRYALTYGGFDVFTLLASRFLLSGIVLTPMLIGRVRALPHGKDIFRFLGVAIVYPGLYYFFETVGISRSSASLASLIIAGIPVLTGVLSYTILGERLGPMAWFGVLLSVAGVAAVVSFGPAAESIRASTLLGAGSVALAAALGALYMVLARNLLSRYSPLTLTAVQSYLGVVFFAPLAIPRIMREGIPGVTIQGLIAVAFLGICASVLSLLAFNRALRMVEATRVALAVNIIPFVSVAVAWAVLGERLSMGQLAGGIVVVVGVIVGSSKAGWRSVPAR